MKVLKEFALVSEGSVFGKIMIQKLQFPEDCENFSKSPQIIRVPDGIEYVHKGWFYNGTNFTAPEDFTLLEKEEDSGDIGYALVVDGSVVGSIYPSSDTELGERLLAGLSSNPILIEVPDSEYVFVGDIWDGEKFIPEE